MSELAAAVSVHDVARCSSSGGRAAVARPAVRLWLVPADEAPGRRPERPHRCSSSRSRASRRGCARAGERPARWATRLVRPGGVRVVPLGPDLERAEPGLAAAMAADRIDALVLVPVTADGRPRGVLVLLLGADGRTAS